MSLRRRFALLAGGAVAVAILLASVAAFFAVRHQLRAEIDRSLADRAAVLAGRPPVLRRFPPPRLGEPGGYVQIVRADGLTRRLPRDTLPLPVDERTLEVARGRRGPVFFDARVQGTHLRVIAAPLAPRLAVEVARPLTEADRALRRVGLILLIVSIGGIGIGALLGRGVAGAALAPVGELTAAVEHVAATRDLSRRIDPQRADELGRLAASFNGMLAALDRSLRSQQQLVADASHELRTPLTSLRTNVEVLGRAAELEPAERGRLLRDVTVQLEELTSLVGDVVELARGAEPRTTQEDVRLDLLTRQALERAQLHAPGLRFTGNLEPSVVRGDPQRLDRAISNLLDNAAKWSPPGAGVEAAVRRGELSVRDHGPGIDADDLPHVFDRFYRAPAARGLPGSGLGLAIVRQVAEDHRASVGVEQPADGGSLFRLVFPSPDSEGMPEGGHDG